MYCNFKCIKPSASPKWIYFPSFIFIIFNNVLRGILINVLQLKLEHLNYFLIKFVICFLLWLILCFITQNFKLLCKEFSICKVSSDDKLWKSLSVASDSLLLKVQLILLQSLILALLLLILALLLLILVLSFFNYNH